jgi:TonB family protein
MKTLLTLISSLFLFGQFASAKEKIEVKYYKDINFKKECSQNKAKYAHTVKRTDSQSFSIELTKVKGNKTLQFEAYHKGEPVGVWYVGNPFSPKVLNYHFTLEYYNNLDSSKLKEDTRVGNLFPELQKVILSNIQENFMYPRIAREQNIQGKIYVYFVCNKNGEIVASKVESALSSREKVLQKEAVRVVRTINKIPTGELTFTKNTLVSLTVPLNFEIR